MYNNQLFSFCLFCTLRNRLFTVPYFSVRFSKLECFNRTPWAILVGNDGWRNLGRVFTLPRGFKLLRKRESGGCGKNNFSRSSFPTQRTLTRDPLATRHFELSPGCARCCKRRWREFDQSVRVSKIQRKNRGL